MLQKIDTKSLKFYFFCLSSHGDGISGGDRIFIEFAKKWGEKYPITLFVWREGYQMCMRQGIKEGMLNFKIIDMEPWSRYGFLINYIARIFQGIKIGLLIKLDNSQNSIIYSASEFWMDSLPAFLLKLRYPNIRWVATWFQTAPNPFKGYAEGQRSSVYRFKSLLYWLVQFPIKPLINTFSNFILVNNELERRQFPSLDKKRKVIVVIGAVNLDNIRIWRSKSKTIQKKYDAIYQGRFHPQKGVVELIEIWKKVVSKKPYAKLGMIGDGPLMNNVKLAIKKLGLEKNIKLFGYVFDGDKKNLIFTQSRIVVHPAFYDSGGMAAAEAMAFGLPCVGFALKSYKSYYPKGMVSVKIFDLDAFSEEIVKLLDDKNYYRKIANEGLEMIVKNWSWDDRAHQVLSRLTKGLANNV